MSYDLFISYSRKDNQEGRITQLVERIRTDFQAFAGRPLNDFFDKDEIKGMDDWRYRILQGLRESHLLLAFLSPTYLQSEYCEWEFNEYLKTEIGRSYFGDGVAPVYFIEVPGWEDKEFTQQCAAWVEELRRRQHFDLRPWFHAGEEALREASVMGKMKQLSLQIKERIQRGERTEASLGNIENHNPHFRGRAVELRRLRETLALGRVGVLTAVHGLGGVGKTALATEYAHAYAHEYGGGRWQVRCESKDNLQAAITSLHGETGLAFEYTEIEKLDLALQYKRVLNELKQLADSHEPHRCLLLLDNVDQPKLLEPAQAKNLPSAEWLHVLATTRLGEKELFGTHKDRAFLPVDELPEADALQMIESYQPGETFPDETERTSALKIVRLLGGFTLAVESAAVYLGKFIDEGVTCSNFLARLKKEGLEGLDTAVGESGEGVLHGEMRLSATLLPTLERLSEAEQLALSYASFLPADQVALPWLRTLVAEHNYPEMGKDAEPGYPDPWKNLLRRLLSLRLLQKTGVISTEGEVLVARIHRLIQELVRSRMTDGEQTVHQEQVDQLVNQRIEGLKETTQWEKNRWELEPLEALATLWAETNHPKAALLLNNAGFYLNELAEWSKTEPLYRRALTIDEQSYGENHPAVARVLNSLGTLLRATSRFAEAEPLYRRALAIYEQSYGENHPDVATVLNNLGVLFQAINRSAEAEPLYRRALAIYERSYGENHPGVAMGLNNLGALLHATNRSAEAEPLYRRALAITEQSYGENHPDVARGLNSLGTLLQATNRFAEAEPLYRRALAITEQIYGKNCHHPEMARGLNSLGALLKATNRSAEAEPLLRRALAIDEQCYGENHPNVARGLNSLGLLLQDTNRSAEAEPLHRRALTIYEQSYGENHPDAAIGLNCLGAFFLATNRSAEAEPLLRRSLAITEQSYGENHPDVAMGLNNLGYLLNATNRSAEAEPLYCRAFTILVQWTRKNGHTHPNLQTAVSNYVDSLRENGSTEEDIFANLQELAPDFFWG